VTVDKGAAACEGREPWTTKDRSMADLAHDPVLILNENDVAYSLLLTRENVAP
jgi:hypothetical protein